MTELSNEPIIPESNQPMSMMDTWVSAVTKPNVATFKRIAAQPDATTTKAILWVFIASLITSFASFIAQAVGSRGTIETFRQFLPPELARELPVGGSPAIGFGTVICGAPVAAVFAVLGFLISVALVQWAAKLFGGTGSFEKLAYTFSAVTVPFSIITAVLTIIGIIPYVGILAGLIGFVLSIYLIVLEVFAVQAVNNLDTGKAIGALLLPLVAIFLLACCCVIAIGAFLVPVIRETSLNLYQSLHSFLI